MPPAIDSQPLDLIPNFEGIRRLSCHTPTFDAIPAVASLRSVALCSVSWRLGEIGVRRRHWASALLRLLRTVRRRLAERRGSTPAFSLRSTNTRGTSSISSRGRWLQGEI
ncbi:hypothetical protein CK203_090385 [Vitis vinifera]|uniref:Uncharacterized protein n=1 Tax=Vitis vinifera TaxID=29760 RepID=A0A438C834_VITVI|nr:hypothetical protein CK203_090385 [Vitis vinifera]